MRFGSFNIDLSQPKIMGILNVTPDSFSDGGQFASLDAALRQAETMHQAGADFIDVGGESTRPGADDVATQEELDRVVPVIEAISQRFEIAVSVDTSKPVVMTEAVACGAVLINDVFGLRRSGALEAAAASKVPVCIMHMQGEPRSMQSNPAYDDVVIDVSEFLRARAEAAVNAGIQSDQILLDPGFGFGKSLEHNLTLLANLQRLTSLGFPLLIGVSRKSMFGQLLGRDVDERLAGSLAAAVESMHRGASILRVHDVAETVDAVRVFAALNEMQQSKPG